jgi:hypothetical protein
MDAALQQRLFIVSHTLPQQGSFCTSPQQAPPSVAGPVVHMTVLMSQQPLMQGTPEVQQPWFGPPHASPHVPEVHVPPSQFWQMLPPSPHVVLDGLMHIPTSPPSGGVQQPGQVTVHTPPQPSDPPHELGRQLLVHVHWNPVEQEPPSHPPQLRGCPHPLSGVPHIAWSDAHVSGVHGPLPHTFGVPGAPSSWAPPHVPPSQPPQSSVPPQPSDVIPHSSGPQRSGVHPLSGGTEESIIEESGVVESVVVESVIVESTMEESAMEESGMVEESRPPSVTPVSIPASTPVPEHWPATHGPVHVAHVAPCMPQVSLVPPCSQ